MKKRLLTILLAVTMVISITACGNTDKDLEVNAVVEEAAAEDMAAQETATPAPTAEPTPEPTKAPVYITEREVVDGKMQSFLTGEWKDEAVVNRRPIAVMIPNNSPAMPQYGISAADVVFEITVEGGLSRMMALYGDYTQVPKSCSIRSCRKYFPELAKGFDAVYVCSGMSNDVRAYVDTLGLTMYVGDDATGGLFGRDQARRDAGYSLEHTMYFDGTGLPAAMANRGERTDIQESKKDTAFKFADQTVVPTGGACNSVTVDFGALTATLNYDAASNTYLKQLNGKDQKDGVTGEQLAFTNVIIMETKVGQDVNGKDRTINWHGGKDAVAYYISNGAMQQIYWVKDSIDSRIIFYDMDGNELAINTGKTYIAINFTGKTTLK